MIIEIIDDETIDVYGETAELADKNAKKFIKIALGNERWLSYSNLCGTVMDKAKLYKVRIRLTKNSDYAKCGCGSTTDTDVYCQECLTKIAERGN